MRRQQQQQQQQPIGNTSSEYDSPSTKNMQPATERLRPGASKCNRILCALASMSALPSAGAMISSNSNLISCGRVGASSSNPLTRLRLTPYGQQPVEDEDDVEAFRNLYREKNTEGRLLGKDFERQAQLENDRKRLSETFQMDASMQSASLFNTANAVVISTPSIQQKRRGRSPPPPVNAAEDNWALILCMALTAQLSQQAAALQDLYPLQQQQQEQLQKQQTVVILFCALALLLASSGYLELTLSHSEIPSLATSFPVLL
ncbi:MAG: hypothetical protein SGBAC_005755 [Bacillariaceae sp.]